MPELGWTVTQIADQEINSAATVEFIRSLNPDLLVVCSARILKPAVFTVPRLGTINVHMGIAPQYRGENTIFWPLYYGDYEHVGITIHEITRGIDTGPVLAQGFPALSPDDTEATIVANAARLAAELLNDIIRVAHDSPLHGSRQANRSRLFLSRDRTMGKQLAYWFRRSLLGHKPPLLPARRVDFH